MRYKTCIKQCINHRAVLAFLVLGAFGVFASAQDETFAKLDILADYPVQHTDYQCVMAAQNNNNANEWTHASCVVDTLEMICLQETAPAEQDFEASVCSRLAYQLWDAKLNEYYERLLAQLSDRQQATLALREAQREWLAFHTQDGSSLVDVWQLDTANTANKPALLLAQQQYKTAAMRNRTEQLYTMLAALE